VQKFNTDTYFLSNIDIFSSIIILLSVMVGFVGGFNQTSLPKMLTYASINQSCSILSAILVREILRDVYLVIYLILTLNTVLVIKPFSISLINQTMLISDNTKVVNFLIFTTFLSLGGLPPFLWFFPKLIVIQFSWRQYAPLKRRSTPTRLHGATSHKNLNLNSISLRFSSTFVLEYLWTLPHAPSGF
jgi:NADH:ubiquinone oxidoreductase subunit 2 (subunit N)